ncbi:hypothetical protein CFC21_043793 [Triticum aestivum]|uniref:Uncharacterized protein n=3 Tax=Triticum TaxID=4564 RepID=A0A9R1QVE5_TRITD|nr:uncharacterized protein LOC119278320 [Triticum dicoccoides]XP_044345364.1 uncharacterized protein LOC123066321 [Triticum aestivum]KAF7032640.1 hypothetical protein CFC21_043793 [Triticum aestivum]VAH84214.1 unnamed protein product [Triticum turgidum subsp. durum]
MAAKGSKKDIDSVLMQAMLAAKTVRAQRDRLLQLQQRLQELQADAAPADAEADADAKLRELASNLFKVYYIGLEAGARILTTCIHLAAEKRILFSPPNLAFAVMPDEQLHDALLAQQFPARPRSQAQAIDRVMAAVLAIKLLEEHLLPRCVECLIGGEAPVPGKTPDSSSPDSSPDRDDDPVAAASEALAKADLSDDPDATAAAKSVSTKPRQGQAARGGGGGDVNKSLDYLYRANRIAGLAVKHIDVAVAVLSRFMDPKRLASLAEFCDDHAYISEEGFYLASD